MVFELTSRLIPTPLKKGKPRENNTRLPTIGICWNFNNTASVLLTPRIWIRNKSKVRRNAMKLIYFIFHYKFENLSYCTIKKKLLP